MVPLLIEMPLDGDERISWLERQLVGFRLHQLISELLVVRCFADHSVKITSLSCLLGTTRKEILHQGLRALSTNQITQLLQSPELLLPLQEIVLVHGDLYWHNLCQANKTVTRSGADLPMLRSPRWPLAVALAIAVSILCCFTYYDAFDRTSIASNESAWGPGRLTGLSTSDLSVDEYFHFLADSAEQWYNQRPLDRETLIKRSEQMIAGCQAVIDVSHPHLPPSRKQRLDHACRQCQRDIAQQIERLKLRQTNFTFALVAIDKSIDRLTQHLQS